MSGRKPDNARTVRNRVLAIRISEEERERLRKISRERFINISALARSLLFENIKDVH